MAKIILGIHGLANKPPREDHAEGWRKAIVEGLEVNEGIEQVPEFDFRLVYWADLLYRHPMHDDELFSFDSLYDAEPYARAEPKALEERRETFLDTVRTSLFSVLGRAADAGRRAIRNDELAEWILGKVARDLAFYYDEDRKLRDRKGAARPAREVIDDELKTALLRAAKDAAGNEIMLVSHSMGTIISYNVLRALGRPRPAVDLPYFVTLGSPLGVPFTKSRIVKEYEYDPVVRTPTIVSKRWINYADPKDPVAADIRLRDDYKANARGVRVEDDPIHNDYRTFVQHGGKREEHHNHHKIYGYLRTPEISELFRGFLGL